MSELVAAKSANGFRTKSPLIRGGVLDGVLDGADEEGEATRDPSGARWHLGGRLRRHRGPGLLGERPAELERDPVAREDLEEDNPEDRVDRDVPRRARPRSPWRSPQSTPPSSSTR